MCAALAKLHQPELYRVPVEVRKTLNKPLMVVLPIEATGADAVEIEGKRREVGEYYLRQGIPIFPTLERALKALANVARYYEHRDERGAERP